MTSSNGIKGGGASAVEALPDVENALVSIFLKYRASILAEGLVMLVFDKGRFKPRWLVGALIGVLASEALWLAYRARRGPLTEDRVAVTTDLVVSAGALVVVAAATRRTSDTSFSDHTFVHHNAFWTTAAVPAWLPDRRRGSAAVGALWAVSCMTGRPGWRRIHAIQEAAYHAAGFWVGSLYTGLLRENARATAQAEASARDHAIAAARAETRSQLHRRVHMRTLRVLETIRDSSSTRGPDVARLAMVEARRLRRVIRSDGDWGEAATGFDELIEECDAAGLRVEFVTDFEGTVAEPRAAVDVARVALQHCLEAGCRSAVVRVATCGVDLEVSVRTQAQLNDAQCAALQLALGGRVLEMCGEFSLHAEEGYGTRVTVRLS